MKKSSVLSLLLLCILAITLIFTSCVESNPNSSTQSSQESNETLKISEGLEYELNEDGQSYSVIGFGTWQGENLVIPSKYNGLPVTALADYSLCDMYYLLPITNVAQMLKGERSVMIKNVVIPDSVITIGQCAFFNCIYLESVIISKSVTSIGEGAFAGCVALKDITIPKSVISIGAGAFAACKSIKSINISENITTIDLFAFVGCISLEKIEVDANNQYYKSIDNNLYSKDGKILIQYALGQNKASFEIPDFVENVAYGAFAYSRKITHITIPESMTTIGEYAFSGCYTLIDIDIPNSVKTIEDWAFESCYALTSITIPESVTSISDKAFFNSNSLIEVCNKSSVNLDINCYIITDEGDSNLVYMGDYVFYDDGIDVYLIKYIGNELEIVLPEYKNGVEYGIYSYAFYDDAIDFARPVLYMIMSDENNGITHITIPEYVTSIGKYAFYGCSLIKEIYIHQNVKEIGEYVFGGCNDLTVYCAASSRLGTWNPLWNANIYGEPNGKQWMIPTVWNYSTK